MKVREGSHASYDFKKRTSFHGSLCARVADCVLSDFGSWGRGCGRPAHAGLFIGVNSSHPNVRGVSRSLARVLLPIRSLGKLDLG
jgi:hypothetical protein